MKIDIRTVDRNNLDWDNDIEYGDVFEFCDKSNSTETYLGMKVADVDYVSDYILELDDNDFCLYDDIENYNFIRIINCTLKED